MTGTVLEIYTAPARGVAMDYCSSVEAVAGEGIAGDRYALGAGSYSRSKGIRDVTLVEVEATWEFFRKTGTELHPGLLRRNIVTEGISLSGLIGTEFTIGGVRLLGLRPCPPCLYLSQLLGLPELLKHFSHSGGIYAQILVGGRLNVGDGIFQSRVRRWRGSWRGGSAIRSDPTRLMT